jgi:hypothetical protein
MKSPEKPQPVSTETILEFNAKHAELGKKEFLPVLEKILLNQVYTIHELEFEFGLSWKDLKPLLDASSSYKIEKENLIITSKTKPEITEEEWQAHLKIQRKEDEIRNRKKQEAWKKLKEIIKITFLKTGEYRSILINKWPVGHEELLETCLELGIIRLWWGKVLVLGGRHPSWNNKM